MSVPAITQDILNTGTILTYADLKNLATWPDGQVGQLPINVPIVSLGTPHTLVWSAFATVDSLRVKTYDSEYFYEGFVAGNRFRYILIPSNIATKSSSMNFRKMSYEEVMDHFALKH